MTAMIPRDRAEATRLYKGPRNGNLASMELFSGLHTSKLALRPMSWLLGGFAFRFLIYPPTPLGSTLAPRGFWCAQTFPDKWICMGKRLERLTSTKLLSRSTHHPKKIGRTTNQPTAPPHLWLPWTTNQRLPWRPPPTNGYPGPPPLPPSQPLGTKPTQPLAPSR